MPVNTGFLDLANPNTSLSSLFRPRKANREGLLFDFRAALVIQPPLAKNERLPNFLALSPHEPAVSFSLTQNYDHLPLLNLYIPARHRLIAELAEAELANPLFSLAHGTLDTIRQGCTGPVCRRLARENRAEAAQLRKARAKKTTPAQTKQHRLRNAAPQYAAVEPLLTAYTILSHYLRPAPNPSKLSKTFKQCNLKNYLLSEFPDIVRP